MFKDAKIKVGIYQQGSHIRVLGECDLITQNNKHKEAAIYLSDFCLIRDPRNDWTEQEQEKLIQNMIRNFEYSGYNFKAKNREDADVFIKSKISKGWNTIKELSEV